MLSAGPLPRELDVIVSTGEQVTIALLAMALNKRGVPAVSYTGSQVRILTDSAHTKARILQIDDQKIRTDLKAGRVVVVAGFQGVDEHGNITTLGRGGSDTPGVALAAAEISKIEAQWQEEAMQVAIDAARAEGAQVVVLLSHNGMDVDLKLASRVRGLDAILGGHTHDGMPVPTRVRNAGGKGNENSSS